MNAIKENILKPTDAFPVEIFIRDNLIESMNTDTHWHDCVEVLFIMDGEATQTVDHEQYKLRAGDVCIIGYGKNHRISCSPQSPCRILVLKFMPEIIDNSYHYVDSKYIHLFLNHRNTAFQLLEKSSISETKLYQLFNEILDEYNTKDTAHELSIKGYILQIIALFIRQGNLKNAETLTKDKYKDLRPAIAYIEEHYHQQLTMTDVAKLTGMSYYHFSRTFKETFGKSFKSYLDYIRICEAEKLLQGTTMKISSIAFEVGFGNVASFNRAFKQIRGMTPSSVRHTKTRANG